MYSAIGTVNYYRIFNIDFLQKNENNEELERKSKANLCRQFEPTTRLST